MDRQATQRFKDAGEVNAGDTIYKQVDLEKYRIYYTLDFPEDSNRHLG